MNITIKTWMRIAASLAFFFCLLGGLWILLHVGFKKDDAVWIGIAFYFIGKAFFVGPMLWIAAEHLRHS